MFHDISLKNIVFQIVVDFSFPPRSNYLFAEIFHIFLFSLFWHLLSCALNKHTGDNSACCFSSMCHEKYKIQVFWNKYEIHKILRPQNMRHVLLRSDRVFAASPACVTQNTRIHQIQLGRTDTKFKYRKHTGLTDFCTFWREQRQVKRSECLLLVVRVGRMPRRISKPSSQRRRLAENNAHFQHLQIQIQIQIQMQIQVKYNTMSHRTSFLPSKTTVGEQFALSTFSKLLSLRQE